MPQDETETEHGTGSGPDEVYVPDPRRWRILWVSLVVGFMSLLDVTIVNVAVPSMRTGLDTSASTIQWVVSGYALTFGLTLVAGGRLGDAYGRRRLMVIGLGLFVASSAAVGLAPSAELVVLARLAQGASAGLLTPQNSGLIQVLFRGAERGRAFGMFGLTVSIASATGPVLGGAIIAVAGEDDGWRWLFLVNVPIGLVALVGILRLVPGRDLDSTGREHIDVPGALLLGATVLCLLYPIVNLEGGQRLPLLLLLGVPVFATAFVRWEHRLRRQHRTPLLDVALLRRTPGYAGGLAVGTLYFTGFTGVLLVLSVWLQDDRGFPPLHAGLLITPFAVGSAISSPLAGRVVTTVGRPLTIGALVTMGAGVLLVALLVPGRADGQLWWALLPALLLAGLGGGAVVSPNLTLTLADVPPRMGGAAGGAVQTGQRLGSALGAAMLVTVFQLAGLRASLLTAIAVLSLALVAALVTRATAAAAPAATTAADA
ncbi:MFS transporter [Nocardioides sp.]|uniref:MFS transporter n=1 Tax=Nocardioides sp. TaxID=35761 RepID=UPI002720C7E9|nr:MFS transporter [Nocardioides sp.]MDO9457244.1 MFS transporter [Nocardioides sp.]